MAETEAEFRARAGQVEPPKRGKPAPVPAPVDMSFPARRPVGEDLPVVLVERDGHLIGRRRRTPADVLGETVRVHRFPRRTKHIACLIGGGEPETADLPPGTERWRPGGAKLPR